MTAWPEKEARNIKQQQRQRENRGRLEESHLNWAFETLLNVESEPGLEVQWGRCTVGSWARQ